MRISDWSSDVCSSDLIDARWLAADWLTADYSYDRSHLQYYNYQFQGVIPSYTPHGQADLFKPYAQSESVYSTHRLDKLATGAPFEPSRTGTQGHTLRLSMPPHETFVVKSIGSYRRPAELGVGKECARTCRSPSAPPP